MRHQYFLHSRPQRLRSIWPAPWIETSGRLQSVLVTDWSDANTIKSDKPEKKHEAMAERHQQTELLRQRAFAREIL